MALGGLSGPGCALSRLSPQPLQPDIPPVRLGDVPQVICINLFDMQASILWRNTGQRWTLHNGCPSDTTAATDMCAMH
ncbi:hypothetical protein E2C01_091477 [Portunus trituberculatus]|uniref:Uncharacterized protein n=1 Tax=Portunus trituberculatus TaxID=210409 RepID=A0A5B7JJ59_PORTR|nr:hypothetical protein [Portunus trituberculatus]